MASTLRINKDQSELLANCFKNSLNLAEKKGLKSIAFPAISTGVYRYPKKDCAMVAKEVFNHYDFNHVKEVALCLFDDDSFNIFKNVLS